MKRVRTLLLPALCALLTACAGGTGGRHDREPLVLIDTARAAGEVITLNYPGKVKASQEASLAFRVAGNLMRLPVAEGESVRAGETLALLDPTDYRRQLDAAEAQFREVEAQAARISALYADSSTTAANYDKAVYGLRQAEAHYRHCQDQLSYTRITAPFDGHVQRVYFDEHETVGAGMPVISLIGSHAPEVEISLPAASYVRRGDFLTFSCTADPYPNLTFPLHLLGIAPKAGANQLYTMRLQMEPVDGILPAPGMNTLVSIACRADSVTHISVPRGALFRREGRAHLFIYRESDSRIEACAVDIVRPTTDGQMLITSPRLQPGQAIVASGVHRLNDGDTVRPLPPSTPSNVGNLL